jgi:hypothetical protein
MEEKKKVTPYVSVCGIHYPDTAHPIVRFCKVFSEITLRGCLSNSASKTCLVDIANVRPSRPLRRRDIFDLLLKIWSFT